MISRHHRHVSTRSPSISRSSTSAIFAPDLDGRLLDGRERGLRDLREVVVVEADHRRRRSGTRMPRSRSTARHRTPSRSLATKTPSKSAPAVEQARIASAPPAGVKSPSSTQVGRHARPRRARSRQPSSRSSAGRHVLRARRSSRCACGRRRSGARSPSRAPRDVVDVDVVARRALGAHRPAAEDDRDRRGQLRRRSGRRVWCDTMIAPSTLPPAGSAASSRRRSRLR